MPSASISIVTYSKGNPGGCIRLLKSLETADVKDIKLEVILVYSGLNDKVQALLNEHTFSFTLQLVPVADEANRAVGRNLGAKTAQHEVLLFLDSDQECSPGLLKRHLALYSDKKTVAVMGEQHLPPFVKKSRWFKFLDSEFRNIRRWAKKAQSNSPPIRYVNTANFSIRKEGYLACEGHRENISNREAQNIDLANRILASDRGQIIYDEEAIAFCQHAPLRATMESRYDFGKEGIPKLLEAYPSLYEKLPSRFVRVEGFEQTGIVKRLLMATLFTNPFLLAARGLRLVGPDWLAFLMMRFMLQYYSILGFKHAQKSGWSIAPAPHS
jgi:hypothetical protein